MIYPKNKAEKSPQCCNQNTDSWLKAIDFITLEARLNKTTEGEDSEGIY